MKAQRLNHTLKDTKESFIGYCDLSADLDQNLYFIASLLQSADSADVHLSDLAHFIVEYLGNRTALEHVFFNRHIGRVEMDKSKLLAEVGRIKRLVREEASNG